MPKVQEKMSEIRSDMTTPSLLSNHYIGIMCVFCIYMCYPSKYQRIIEQAILSVSIIILNSKIASRLTVVKFPLFA